MRILILAPPGVQSLDVVGPAEIFWEVARRLGDENAYRIEIVATQAGPIPGTGSLRFLPDRTIDEPEIEADTLRVDDLTTTSPLDVHGSPLAVAGDGAT
jgi:hypothetical protein